MRTSEDAAFLALTAGPAEPAVPVVGDVALLGGRLAISAKFFDSMRISRVSSLDKKLRE